MTTLTKSSIRRKINLVLVPRDIPDAILEENLKEPINSMRKRVEVKGFMLEQLYNYRVGSILVERVKGSKYKLSYWLIEESFIEQCPLTSKGIYRNNLVVSRITFWQAQMKWIKAWFVGY